MESLPKDLLLQFNPDTLEHVRKLYNLYNPERLEQALQILENWVEKQNHFTVKKFDRGYLERVLIFSKGSVEKAKSQLDYMCTSRTLLPKLFVYCNLKEDLNSILSISCTVPMPKMTKDYHRVYIIKVTSADIKPNDFLRFCLLNIMTSEYLKLHDYFKGVILVEDYRGINLMDLISKINLVELKDIMTVIIKGFGARLKEIHVINESKILDLILNIGKQVLSAKIVSRLKCHQGIESLHEYIDPSILPVELGGTERSLDTIKKEWIDRLSSEDYIEYIKKMNEARTDETRRLEETFNSMYMGTPGSFRNLVVD